MAHTVALVTGCNRGIGFEICRQLCSHFKDNGTIILTARNEEKGVEACKTLKMEGFKPVFMKLDVTCKLDAETILHQIQDKYGGLDMIVNNAGFTYTRAQIQALNISYAEQVKNIVETNFFGIQNVCKSLFPLLKSHSRVVHVTSSLGDLSILRKDLRKQFCSPSLTINELTTLMNQYVKDVAAGIDVKNGWPEQNVDSWAKSAYCVSKIGVTVLASVQAREMSSDPRTDILINSVCPGWVRTDLGGPMASKSAEEGAADVLHCAFLPEEGPNGNLFTKKQVAPFFTKGVPVIRLKKVPGFDGRYNDLVFSGEDAMQHVIFFPGDVQDFVEEMKCHKTNKAWQEWNLESTATLLTQRFPKSFIWIVKANVMTLGTFACYSNFVETNMYGTPDHRNSKPTAIKHLRDLLNSAVRRVLDLESEEEDITASFPILLVGFSKGCAVLNQIVHELPDLFISDDKELKNFIDRIDIAYWLDSGNSGHSDAWITDDHCLFHLARNIPKIRVHVTPYQIMDSTRSWIGVEEKTFVNQLKSLEADIKETLHFKGKKPSLADHFYVLKEFKKAVHV